MELSDDDLFIHDNSPATGRRVGDTPTERNAYFHERMLAVLRDSGDLDDDGFSVAVEGMWTAAEHDQESGLADD